MPAEKRAAQIARCQRGAVHSDCTCRQDVHGLVESGQHVVGRQEDHQVPDDTNAPPDDTQADSREEAPQHARTGHPSDVASRCAPSLFLHPALSNTQGIVVCHSFVIRGTLSIRSPQSPEDRFVKISQLRCKNEEK